MKPPKLSNDYAQGQMMGMLVIIQLLENARDTKIPIPMTTFDTIKRVATESLADYLQKPEEDIILLVNQQLSAV